MRISDWSSDVCSSDLVPGLTERREDIPELVRYFVQAISVASGLAPRRIGEDAMAVLQSHDWPGRSEERRVGKECVSTCRSRWSPYPYKKKQIIPIKRTSIGKRLK